MQQFPYIAEIFVIGGIASAAVIAVDLRQCRQPMHIMNSVWILTGLWASFFGLWAYYAFGRVKRCALDEKQEHAGGMDGMKSGGMEMDGMRMGEMAMPPRSRWQSVVLSTLHCGAGCTLADLVGEWFLYFVPVAIGGSLIAGSWVIDYILALGFGIGFQYAAIRGMEPKAPRGEIVRRAAKADILSLTAWQAGMYGWMAVVIFAFNDGSALPRTSFQFWFMMQVAMACGFLVALPVNIGLIRAGIKKGM
ncbi:DUF4396 domain-containing protein [uncultured Alistipes sp.]|uniref:DUF4396 domain-containing protein n=1 Tax=uncultured Alistipes sp. TaxID=538949 RepID=UPI00258FE348|nr:DUF4396 domain-containing protein [uncultured Alistipes sp.]